MKVVLFCGGLGTRLREYGHNIPKPLVPIGYRPVIWHVMKYYAHYGHKEFILCLGYRADTIKKYFLEYDEYITNDFTMSEGGSKVSLMQSDIQDWKITFVDTDLNSNIGTRLMKVREHIGDDELFFANYTDGLTDYPLDDMLRQFNESEKTGAFLCAPPSQTFHVVQLSDTNNVESIQYVKDTDLLVNCGYFIFKNEIFDYIKPGEELVIEPFRRLMSKNQLLGIRTEKFWAMDTFKEQQELADLFERGDAPWVVWKSSKNHDSE